jgi:hypothetical protein
MSDGSEPSDERSTRFVRNPTHIPSEIVTPEYISHLKAEVLVGGGIDLAAPGCFLPSYCPNPLADSFPGVESDGRSRLGRRQDELPSSRARQVGRETLPPGEA